MRLLEMVSEKGLSFTKDVEDVPYTYTNGPVWGGWRLCTMTVWSEQEGVLDKQIQWWFSEEKCLLKRLLTIFHKGVLFWEKVLKRLLAKADLWEKFWKPSSPFNKDLELSRQPKFYQTNKRIAHVRVGGSLRVRKCTHGCVPGYSHVQSSRRSMMKTERPMTSVQTRPSSQSAACRCLGKWLGPHVDWCFPLQ